MDAEFWHRKWKERDIGFHAPKANELLVRYFGELAPTGRVFLPLCGKTLDIQWLLAQGYSVAGAELNETAVRELFGELGIDPVVTEAGKLRLYSDGGTGEQPGIDIFVGDIFDLSPAQLGPVDAVYDRAALVALPGSMRGRYTAHLLALTHQVPQLLITFEYDQRLIDGPPFSITPAEVERHYGDSHRVTLAERRTLPGGLKGMHAADESAWILERK
ncbi:thiopurine S-methyltransferase [Microbulbifer sediminum]|uniref:thiopurine S-methyltransferase n=1 Tax=Microbulbifer sediminum TaxID=2904250 RepID=UPI001EFFD78D|nr:thiopurine S-methyltransferase [Microbulbifer sediminum]